MLWMGSKEMIFPIIFNGKKDNIVSLVENVALVHQLLILILYVWLVHFKQNNLSFSVRSAALSHLVFPLSLIMSAICYIKTIEINFVINLRLHIYFSILNKGQQKLNVPIEIIYRSSIWRNNTDIYGSVMFAVFPL